MTIEIKNKIVQIYSFIDEAFDVKKTLNYQLIFQIGIDGVLITVNEKEKNKYIAFEKFTFQNVYNFDSICDTIDLVLKESKLFNHTYKKTDCLIVNSISTIVPEALYEDDKKKLYLKFNTSLEGNEFILVDPLKSMEAKNIFAMPFNLKIKLDYLFKNIIYHHFSSSLIDGLVSENKNQTGKKIYVHIQSSQFEVLIVEGKNLLFYNTFNYHSAEDFIYYLLFVFEQLHLNPEKAEVTLLGELDKESAIYSITQKYIRHIKFGERTANADYSYQLQTLPKHSFFTLFNNYFS